MADDPKFVRLHNRLARGSQVDLASGFGISGLDIVPFPKDPDQAAHVRDGLRRGVYDQASDDEVKAFQGRENDYLERTGVAHEAARHQEGQVRALADADRLEIEGSRGLGRNNVAAYEADQARRDALLEADGGKTSKGSGKGSKADQAAAEEEAKRVAAEAEAAALAGAGKQPPAV